MHKVNDSQPLLLYNSRTFLSPPKNPDTHLSLPPTLAATNLFSVSLDLCILDILYK